MKRPERLMAALRGEAVDRVPIALGKAARSGYRPDWIRTHLAGVLETFRKRTVSD